MLHFLRKRPLDPMTKKIIKPQKPEDVLICPLGTAVPVMGTSSITNSPQIVGWARPPCVKEQCAWWDEHEEQCSVKTIGVSVAELVSLEQDRQEEGEEWKNPVEEDDPTDVTAGNDQDDSDDAK